MSVFYFQCVILFCFSFAIFLDFLEGPSIRIAKQAPLGRLEGPGRSDASEAFPDTGSQHFACATSRLAHIQVETLVVVVHHLRS